eukprot:TRINITY_DN10065_c0_g1_i2.p1 TRINITY_DN10065_c0_g1~~TRINITY_DN10065_c0_g1_i2.p1  ORF type:complete len:548 (+),score=177.83 TRINITY_DN10065_c0_g1_i2:81-1724(+)
MASLIAFCLFAHLLYSASAFSFPWFQSESLVQEKRVESGRSALAALTLRAESNKCFHGAVEQLSSGCRELSEDDRRRLSVKLASCHVEKSGLPTFECTPDMSVEECTRPMTSVDIAFNAYSMFFLQVDSICYALQAERFQARTESLVSELVQNSVSAVESLGTLQTQSVDVADAMNRSLAAHDRLQYQQDELELAISNLTSGQSMAIKLAQDQFASLHNVSGSIHAATQLTLATQVELGASQRQMLDAQRQLHEQQQDVLSDLGLLKQKQAELNELADRVMAKQTALLRNQEQLSDQQADVQSSLRSFEGRMTQANTNLAALFDTQSRALLQTTSSVEQLTNFSANAFNSIAQHYDYIVSVHGQVLESVSAVENFQAALLGEFFDVKTVFFYLGAMALAYLMTTAERTKAARLPLLMALVAMLLVERLLLTSYPPETGAAVVDTLRRGYVGFAVLTLCYAVLSYRDYARLQYVESRRAFEIAECLGRKSEGFYQSTEERLHQQQLAIETLRHDLLQLQHAMSPLDEVVRLVRSIAKHKGARVGTGEI